VAVRPPRTRAFTPQRDTHNGSFKNKTNREEAMQLVTGTLVTNTLAFSLSALLFSTLPALAQAPSWSPPPDSERCPSRWGAADERGAANHVTPQSVLNALKLVKTGEMIELAHALHANMPFSGPRRFDVHLKVPNPVPGSNNRVTNEEIVVSEIGQVGTQFDGFGHQSHAGSHYNCFKTNDIATRAGFRKLGVHNVGTLIARAVLIDVAGLLPLVVHGRTDRFSPAWMAVRADEKRAAAPG
jgi:hypothetical protein